VSHPSARVCQPASSQSLRIVGRQEAGRQTVAALDQIARQRGWALELLGLNDVPGSNVLRVEEREILFAGFGRTKFRFVRSALRHARADVRVVLAAHPHLALPALLMKIRAPALNTIVMSHGIEVWKPLPPLRRLALQRADRVLAPSSDTARKLADVQSVAKEKIRKLAWPVNARFFFDWPPIQASCLYRPHFPEDRWF
jgi:hypothetical protein